MKLRAIWIIAVGLLLTCCVKEGDTIYMPTPGERQPAATPLVTVIYGPNGLGDRSYCDLIYKGVEAAGEKYGVRTLQLSPESEAQGLAYIETMFQQMENLNDTVRRLFVTPSPVYDAYIRANNHRLEKNPNADLLYMETTTPLEGKGSTFYIDYYGAMYMSGSMARYQAENVVTLLLANPYTQTVREAGDGFVAGFNATSDYKDKHVELHVRYLSDELVGGFTIPDSTAIRIFGEEVRSLAERKRSYVTLVPVCGGAMNSFIRAVRTLGITDNYVGIDGDMTDDRSFCLFSTVKHVDTVLIDYIGLWLNGAMPKHQLFGLADGTTEVIRGEYAYKALGNGVQLEDVVDLDSLRQVAIGKEEERYGK